MVYGYSIELARVDFWATETITGEGGWIRVKQDNLQATPYSSSESKTTGWKLTVSGSIEQNPVAYASGSRPTVSACFRLTGTAGLCPSGSGRELEANYWVKGEVYLDGIKEMDLAQQRLSDLGQDTYEYPELSANKHFQFLTVNYYETLIIKWYYSKTGEESGDWLLCGTSDTPVYVTLKPPVAENPGAGYSYFRTLLHISCAQGDGATSEVQLVDGVWTHISGRTVTRFDGQPLKYYGQWTGGNLGLKTNELISNTDGECASWTRFFLDLLKLHGIQYKNNYVIMTSNQQGFFIKHWVSFGGPGSSGNSDFPYENVKGTPFRVSNSYNWDQSEVYVKPNVPPQDIIAGQGPNNNPESIFGQHIVARPFGEGGVLYDPSYGKLRGTINVNDNNKVPDFDNDAVDVFYVAVPGSDNVFQIQVKNDQYSPITSYIKVDDFTGFYSH